MTSNNPLFPSAEPADHKPDDTPVASDHLLPAKTKTIAPLSKGGDKAANVIRQKLKAIYATEPGVKKELAELAEADKPLSKHQQYLSDLQTQSLSVADIQVKWHEYYNALPEADKQAVWQEFYSEQAKHSQYNRATTHHSEQKTDGRAEAADSKAVVSHHEISTPSAAHKRLRDARTKREVRDTIIKKIDDRGLREAGHPLHSVLFGLGIGAIVLVITLFSFFNEIIVAPFIQPSSTVSATPIILDNNGIAADGTTKIVIPKINVEIPIDFSLKSMAEADIQKGLESGVVHYPSTVKPGEQGNAAFFGHSSNNIFNPGQYKFAFVLLSNLQAGDMFYVTYEKKVYAYKVYDKKSVSPEEVSILGNVPGKTATAALITCDPPGTTLRRLVVWGEQVSPDPAANTASSQAQASGSAPGGLPATNELPGPAPSLWSRLTGWL